MGFLNRLIDLLIAFWKWFANLLQAGLPDAIGSLLAAAVSALLGALVIRWRRASARAPAGEIGNVIKELVPEFANRFVIDSGVATTEHDEAGLALVSALIAKRANKVIEVVGRGSQWIEPRTRQYVESVARAVRNGVRYSRILILDRQLPQNGLVWLLLTERFVALPSYRGLVSIIPVRTSSQSLNVQFQLIDRTYLNRTNRYYDGAQPGADRRAHSSFIMGPHPEVSEQVLVFQFHVEKNGPPRTHLEIAELLEELLTSLNPETYALDFHSRIVLEVTAFLDSLRVDDLPGRGIAFVGSLMPFTFTFEAAKRFAISRRSEYAKAQSPVVVLPFESFEEAIDAFEMGRIDFVCLPKTNTTIDHVPIPTVSDKAAKEFRKKYGPGQGIDVDVSFQVVGRETRGTFQKLAAVNAAFEQVKKELGPELLQLPRIPGIKSNYHAAWAASRDGAIAAVTTPAAAALFGLHPSGPKAYLGKGSTTFEVFTNRPASPA